MFVCVCKAVSDRQIRRAVREDGVTSLRELSRRYGLGNGCGKCIPQARELLAAEQGVPVLRETACGRTSHVAVVAR